MSKIVFRDYGAPGGDRAIVVLRNGSFRIPSRICVTASEFLLGNDTATQEECDIYESVKMRAAAEATGNPEYYFGPSKEPPHGFSVIDLATLVGWHLISEGRKAVDSYLEHRVEGVNIGMTLGVPMAFFNDTTLKLLFLSIARRAWQLYRNEGLLGSVLLVEKARQLLEKYQVAALPEIPNYEVRNWIRSEGEAAMWWPFQSPTVGAGPYAKIDIGAGTTHSSLFRIFGDPQMPKRGIAFFGAVTVPVGMDAVDHAIVNSDGLGGDCLALRGLEQSILEANAKARGAIIPVRKQIYEAYRKGWIQTYRKIQNYAAEINAWRSHRIFMIGGGSCVPLLSDPIMVHPAGSDILIRPAPLDPPPDLFRADGSGVRRDELPFLSVAYGLSNISDSIPEALAPDDVPPMPDQNERRARLDRDDIYAK